MYKLKLKIDTSTNNEYIQDMVTVPPLTRVTRMDLVEQKVMEGLRLKKIKQQKDFKK